tara:strand:+ start:103 stop:498 length:396 start_codon:yes stop_codon:yes gene_type:complete
MLNELSVDNFFLYAAQNYQNPHCTGIDDFNEDLNHIKYIKRLFNRYQNKGVIKINLIVNHLILLYNVFESEAMTKILFFKIPEEQWSLLKPFLILLNRLPESISGVLADGEIINTVDISLNQDIVSELRTI